MNSSTKNFVLTILGIIVGIWALRFAVHLALSLIFNVVIPVAIVGGVIYGGYLLFGRKALGPGNRRTLP